MTTIAVTNTNLYFSPGNSWSDGSGTLQSNNVLPGSTKVILTDAGAYLKGTVLSGGSGSITLDLDTTSLIGLGATTEPYIAWSLDGGAYTTQQLVYSASTVQVTIGSSLAVGNHTFRIINSRIPSGNVDAWTTPLQCVTVTAIEIDSGSSMVAPTLRPKIAYFFGDSELAGFASPFDASTAWSENVAWSLNAEHCNVAKPGQGYQIAGQNNVPLFGNIVTPANSTWRFYSSGKSRLTVTGQVQPDYVFIAHGTNDGSHATNTTNVTTAVKNALTEMRTAWPSAKLFCCIPPYQWYDSFITAGYNNYITASSDASAFLLDAGSELVAYLAASGQNLMGDLAHPNQRGHAVYGSIMAAKAQAAISAKTSALASRNFLGM